MANAAQAREKNYPEEKVGGFTHVDSSVQFYTRIAALIRPTDHVLDFGAGRGAQIETDISEYSRFLKTLKGRVSHLEGCDVDSAVLDNPYLDSATIFDPLQPLPYADNTFDLIYSNWVFEHVPDPEVTARELLRVVKPGGYICALTPNKNGYIAHASRLAGNARHISLLKRIQPHRLEFDVFPTCYRLNTTKDLKKYFGEQSDVVVYGMSAEPAYHFNSALMYSLFMVIHKITPAPFHTTLLVFIRKHS